MLLPLADVTHEFSSHTSTLSQSLRASPRSHLDPCLQYSVMNAQAIATNLTAMAALKVPIVTIIVGEGGSGGALGIGMGNRIGTRLTSHSSQC